MLSTNEKRRRLWAASHVPELVTTEQALEMFGHRSFTGFKRFMEISGVKSYNFKIWPNSTFYAKAEIVTVAEQYLRDNPQRQKNVDKLAIRASKLGMNTPEVPNLKQLNRFVPDRGWSKEQFLEYWGSVLDLGATLDIMDRAPSVFLMRSKEAYVLIATLTNSTTQIYGGFVGYRMDRSIFVGQARQICKNPNLLKKLVIVINDLHKRTDIGKLDPELTVRVIYELMQSAQ
jgi:hypothetical protein